MDPMRLKACEHAEWRAETLARMRPGSSRQTRFTETSCARLLVGRCFPRGLRRIGGVGRVGKP